MKPEKDHAVIETAEEAGVFPWGIGEQFRVLFHDGVNRVWQKGVMLDGLGTAYPARYTRAEILEAITPKEGDAVFYWFEPTTATWGKADVNKVYYMEKFNRWQIHARYIKANAITIGKTVDELRELLEWCRAIPVYSQ